MDVFNGTFMSWLATVVAIAFLWAIVGLLSDYPASVEILFSGSKALLLDCKFPLVFSLFCQSSPERNGLGPRI